MFFPERGGSTKEAKKICARCLVRPECAAYGDEHNEYGIWGGYIRKRSGPSVTSDDEAEPVAV